MQIAWYRKAADQDHPGAQYSLGLMYADGQGVKDDTQAEALWRKAADQGHAQSQYSLGLMYAREKSLLGGLYFSLEGVQQDYVEAHKWLSLAASHATGEDQKTFAHARDTLREAMTPAQLARAQQRAADWQAAFDK
jgi:TPR repeat protein